jgi:hypothetical protein
MEDISRSVLSRFEVEEWGEGVAEKEEGGGLLASQASRVVWSTGQAEGGAGSVGEAEGEELKGHTIVSCAVESKGEEEKALRAAQKP